MKKIIISMLKFYSNYLSTMKLKTCRFEPTCSQYLTEAVNKKGVIKGITQGIRRILRCRPFGPYGYDPVE